MTKWIVYGAIAACVAVIALVLWCLLKSQPEWEEEMKEGEEDGKE